MYWKKRMLDNRFLKLTQEQWPILSVVTGVFPNVLPLNGISAKKNKRLK